MHNGETTVGFHFTMPDLSMVFSNGDTIDGLYSVENTPNFIMEGNIITINGRRFEFQEVMQVMIACGLFDGQLNHVRITGVPIGPLGRNFTTSDGSPTREGGIQGGEARVLCGIRMSNELMDFLRQDPIHVYSLTNTFHLVLDGNNIIINHRRFDFQNLEYVILVGSIPREVHLLGTPSFDPVCAVCKKHYDDLEAEEKHLCASSCGHLFCSSHSSESTCYCCGMEVLEYRKMHL